MYRRRDLWALAVIAGLVFLSSCQTYKTVPYFTDLAQTGQESIRNVPYHEPVIMIDDILAVNVTTVDPATNGVFQQSATDILDAAATASGGTVPVTQPINRPGGYLVDKEGNIELPFAGIMHVAGLTRLQARDTIYNRLAVFFKNPTVDLRFANFKITVIGEVTRPASYTMPNEKVTIFDAIGIAGDLTVFGKRENVLLIRDSADVKNFVRLNLNSKELITSPYFYLKQNDVVYVEPDKAKAITLDVNRTRFLALLGPALSLLIVIASRISIK